VKYFEIISLILYSFFEHGVMQFLLARTMAHMVLMPMKKKKKKKERKKEEEERKERREKRESLQDTSGLPAVPKINFTILKQQLMENEKKLLRQRNPTANGTEISVMAKVFAPQCPDALFTIE
jgi:hypothetical protein